MIKAFFVADRIGVAHAGQVGNRRNEVFANAFHRPGTGGGEGAAAAVFGHHRTDRVGQDHFQVRLHAFEEAGQPGEGTGRTDADDDGVHIMLGLRPDLRRGAAFVGQRVGRVVELVGEERIGNFRRQPRGNVLVVLGMALADVGAGDVHLGAHGLEVQDLLGGHLVRHHQHHPVTLGAADQGQAEAGVAGGGFDDGAAGAQAAIAFGGVDHRQTDAVLDRTAGVLGFEFEKQRTRAGIESADAYQWGVADQFEHGRTGIVEHVITPCVNPHWMDSNPRRVFAPVAGNASLGP
ncbi:hypothetical protein D3C86_1389790 [compost metagenome]